MEQKNEAIEQQTQNGNGGGNDAFCKSFGLSPERVKEVEAIVKDIVMQDPISGQILVDSIMTNDGLAANEKCMALYVGSAMLAELRNPFFSLLTKLATAKRNTNNNEPGQDNGTPEQN